RVDVIIEVSVVRVCRVPAGVEVRRAEILGRRLPLELPLGRSRLASVDAENRVLGIEAAVALGRAERRDPGRLGLEESTRTAVVGDGGDLETPLMRARVRDANRDRVGMARLIAVGQPEDLDLPRPRVERVGS